MSPTPQNDDLWHDYSMQLGHNLRTARNDKGWTLERLALRTGLSLGYIANLERGKGSTKGSSNMSLRNLITIATALDVDITDLLPPERAVPSLAEITERKYGGA